MYNDSNRSRRRENRRNSTSHFFIPNDERDIENSSKEWLLRKLSKRIPASSLEKILQALDETTLFSEEKKKQFQLGNINYGTKKKDTLRETVY
jgi:hypothetical protein